MKKILTILFIICGMQNVVAQNTDEKITVLKGGITVLRFAKDITNFKLVNRNDYNINIEEDRSIRIWAKAGVANPAPTELIVTEDNINHTFNIQYKEKGDYNSTYYDYTNKSKQLNATVATKTEEKIQTTTTTQKTTTTASNAKLQEERAKVLAEEKRKRDERIALEQKKQTEMNAKIAAENGRKLKQENELKILAEKKKQDELNAAIERMKKEEMARKVLDEEERQKTIQAQIDREQKEKEEKEAILFAEKQRKQVDVEKSRLARAEEINLANAKKIREENERRLELEKQLQAERQQALELEKAKREQLLASIAAEKQKQELLDQRIAQEKKIREVKLETEKKILEVKRITEEKNRIEEELVATKLAEQQRIAEEKRVQIENEKRLIQEKQKQQEAAMALMSAKKEQEELMQKIAAEKQQSEALEKMLAEEKRKREQKEKTLEVEKKVVYAETKTNNIHKTIADTKNNISFKNAETGIPSDSLIEQPKPDFSSASKFPNLSTIPQGQLFEPIINTDSTTLSTTSNTLINSASNANFANASTEMDKIKLSLNNIKIENDIAYIHFTIENNTPDYFLLGATQLKILDAETGKKILLNPYYISSFPVVDPNAQQSVVYAMKLEKNISPDSFVMITIKERQTNKKFELNFPGNFYTEAISNK